jgi:hypothetical protein
MKIKMPFLQKKMPFYTAGLLSCLFLLLAHFHPTAAATTLTNNFKSVQKSTTTNELLALGHRWRIQDTMGTSGKASVWKLDNGQLKQSQGTCSSDHNSLLLTGGSGHGWSDYCVSIKILPDEGGCANYDIGVVLRYVNEKNYYRVALRRTSNTYTIDLSKHDDSHEGTSKKSTSTTSAATVLTACVAGRHFSIFRGTTDTTATPLFTYKDNDAQYHNNGAVGLACRGRPCAFDNDFVVSTPPPPFVIDNNNGDPFYVSDGSGTASIDVTVAPFYQHGDSVIAYVEAGKDVRVVSPLPGDASGGGTSGFFAIASGDSWKKTMVVRAYASGATAPVNRKITLSLHPEGGAMALPLQPDGSDVDAAAMVYGAHGVNKTMDWEGGDAFCGRASLRVCTYLEYCPSGQGQAPANGAVGSAVAWAPVGGTPDMWVSLAAGSQCQTKTQPNDGTTDGISFNNRVGSEPQKGHIYCCNSLATNMATLPFPPVVWSLDLIVRRVASNIPSPTIHTSPTISSETVTLTWNNPATKVLDAILIISGYIVRRKSGTAASSGNTVLYSIPKISDPSQATQSFSDEKLRPQSQYTYDVATVTSSGGQSMYSTVLEITTLDKGTSLPPTNAPIVQKSTTPAAKTTGAVTFNWNKATNTGGLKLKQYRIHRSERCYSFDDVSNVGTGRNYTKNDTLKRGVHGPVLNMNHQSGWGGLQGWKSYSGDLPDPAVSIVEDQENKLQLTQFNTNPGLLQAVVTSQVAGSDVLYILSPEMSIKANVAHVLTIRGTSSTSTAGSNVKMFVYDSINSPHIVEASSLMTTGAMREHVLRVSGDSVALDTTIRVGLKFVATPNVGDTIDLDIVCFHPAHFTTNDDYMAGPTVANSIPDNALELSIVPANVLTFTDSSTTMPHRYDWCTRMW